MSYDDYSDEQKDAVGTLVDAFWSAPFAATRSTPARTQQGETP